jgi:hypothetical protein
MTAKLRPQNTIQRRLEEEPDSNVPADPQRGVRGNRLYLLGYSGPADDTADFAAFEGVVRSLKINEK